MSNLVPIGRFSKTCRLSIKALRLYDELGLLKPVQVDPGSGYRYYRLSQARDAQTIRLLRSLDMPLKEIRKLLAASDPAGRQARLAAHRARIEEHIAEYQRSLATLECFISSQERIMSYKIKVKQVEPEPFLCIRRRAAQSELTKVIPATLTEVRRYLQIKDIHPAGPPIVAHVAEEWGEEGDELIMDLELGVTLKERMPTEGEVVMSAIPGGTVASLRHVGPYDQLSLAFAALAVWIQEHGHESVGGPREIYWSDPEEVEEVKDPQQYVTEIAWPIRYSSWDSSWEGE